MISKDQIAHDLTIVYLNNRYGINVSGSFDVSSDSQNDTVSNVYGSGNVTTDRFPDINETVTVGTGEKTWLIFEKTKQISAKDYLIGGAFRQMIQDYYTVFSLFRELLGR